jgi:hypothetical protein
VTMKSPMNYRIHGMPASCIYLKTSTLRQWLISSDLFYTNMRAKPSLEGFCPCIHGSETKTWEVLVYIYMGAKPSLGRFLSIYTWGLAKTVMKELAGPHELFLLMPRLQKQSDHQTTYTINRVNYSKLRNYSLSPDF